MGSSGSRSLIAILIQPTGSRVLVRRKESPSSIIITDAEKWRYVEVLAVGPNVTEVKPGQVVSMPGVGSNEPDWVFDDGTLLVQENDFGFIVHTA